MNNKAPFLLLCFLLLADVCLFGQETLLIGRVVDEQGQGLSRVAIGQIGETNSVLSDENGYYSLSLQGDGKAAIRAKLLGYEMNSFNLHFRKGDSLTREILMRRFSNTVGEVQVRDQRLRGQAGMSKIDIDQVNKLPSTVGGVEGLLKILVGSHNELTSQYTVRGGNYDENLVYVNGFEIYRPFLIHSGQQEGLSFVNSDLVQNVDFSVGGFQAKYGDKMSSVLDVTYKRPQKFAGSVLLSLLGANAHLEGTGRNRKFSYLLGVRQKSNRYLLNAQPIKGEYTPSFSDFQALLRYDFNPHWSLSLIGNYARNRFDFLPQEQEAAFGYVNQALLLHTNFNGQEHDQFDSYFGGMAIDWKPNDKTHLTLQASGFRTREFQTYDIYGEYGLYEVETDLGKTDLGQTKASLGTGIIHDFARDYLTADVLQIKHLGSYDVARHFILWGADLKQVKVDDQILEWQRRDSAGFSVPYRPGSLNMATLLRSQNNLEYLIASAFVQNNILLNEAKNMTLTVGLRGNYHFLNKELILSPRVQFAFKPDWDRDMVFRFASGIYAQPPFYQEMRAWDGKLNTRLKAQKSWHYAMGMDYNFQMWGDRPFKITGELFYKQLWDLVPYEYDNLNIRYYATNSGKGYAYGGEVRLYGDLVKGTPSWVSLGFLNTKQRIWDQVTETYGPFLPRPTDQRVNVGLFFSDYLPRNKNFKMYLNAVYASGLPFSPPGKGTNPIYNKLRLPDYKRVDIGFSALLLDGANKKLHAYSLFNAFNDIWMSLEVFNLLGIQNTISYQWIEDFTTHRTYAVPNRLTSRLLNVKIEFRF